MKNRVLKYLFRDYVTLMWVGTRGGQIKQFRLSVGTLWGIGLGMGSIMVWSLYVTASTANLGTLILRQKAVLEQGVKAYKTLEGQLQDQRVALFRLQNMEDQLAQLLDLGDGKKMLSHGRLLEISSGTGGPQKESSKDLSLWLQRVETDLRAKMNSEIQKMEAAAQMGEGRYVAISKELEAVHHIAASTPRGLPARGWITSAFGLRFSPTRKEEAMHHGVDIANEAGTPIRATADGVVVFAGKMGDYGKMVMMKHGFDKETRYGHLKNYRVRPGVLVRRGEIIGTMGSTGSSTGTHVHYEVLHRGKPMDPEPSLGKEDF